MQKAGLIIGFLLVIALISISILAGRDYVRIRIIKQAIKFVQVYKADYKVYPSNETFLKEFPDWYSCTNYCYASDGTYFRMVYYLNSYYPFPGTMGYTENPEPQLSAKYILRSCEIEGADCPDPALYY